MSPNILTHMGCIEYRMDNDHDIEKMQAIYRQFTPTLVELDGDVYRAVGFSKQFKRSLTNVFSSAIPKYDIITEQVYEGAPLHVIFTEIKN